ncbi:MAG: hypothetical protein Q4E99_03075, partial [Bacillota bacterium]|nr:hypothetical protein [Bacillota bacterium]
MTTVIDEPTTAQNTTNDIDANDPEMDNTPNDPNVDKNLPDFNELWNDDDDIDDEPNQGDSKDTNTEPKEPKAKEPTEPKDSEPSNDTSDNGDNQGDPKDTEPSNKSNGTDGNEPSSTADNGDGNQPSNEPFLNIKFNKEEIGLTKDQAAKFAQMGLLSEKAIEQRNGYKAKLDEIETIAKDYGMDLDAFINSVKEQSVQVLIDKELDALKNDKRYEGTSEEVLKEIATLKVNESKKSSQIAQRDQADSQAADKNKELQAQISRFTIAHPEISVDKIREVLTDEMYKLMDQGLSVLEAY